MEKKKAIITQLTFNINIFVTILTPFHDFKGKRMKHTGLELLEKRLQY
jgi:hypothetical protein